MKSLFSVLLLFFCCSFTICDKFVKREKGEWLLYIYPDCSDRSIYIVQNYHNVETRIERKSANEKWKRYNCYSIEERWIVHDSEIAIAAFNYNHWFDSRFYEDAGTCDKGMAMSATYLSPPIHSFLTLNGKSINIEYNKDGTIKTFKVFVQDSKGNWTHEGIEWEDGLKFNWKGNYSYQNTNKLDTTFRKDPVTGRETYETNRHTELIKTGYWKKYNRRNVLVDSMFY